MKATAKTERDFAALVADFPGDGEARFEGLVCRLRRIKTPPVR